MLIVVSSGSLSASLQWAAQNSLMMPLIILPLPICFQSLSYLCCTESLRYEFCALCEQSKYTLLGGGGSTALQDFRQEQECLLDGVLPGRAVSYYSGGFPVTVIPRPLLYTYPPSSHLRLWPGFTIYACCLGWHNHSSAIHSGAISTDPPSTRECQPSSVRIEQDLFQFHEKSVQFILCSHELVGSWGLILDSSEEDGRNKTRSGNYLDICAIRELLLRGSGPVPSHKSKPMVMASLKRPSRYFPTSKKFPVKL